MDTSTEKDEPPQQRRRTSTKQQVLCARIEEGPGGQEMDSESGEQSIQSDASSHLPQTPTPRGNSSHNPSWGDSEFSISYPSPLVMTTPAPRRGAKRPFAETLTPRRHAIRGHGQDLEMPRAMMVLSSYGPTLEALKDQAEIQLGLTSSDEEAVAISGKHLGSILACSVIAVNELAKLGRGDAIAQAALAHTKASYTSEEGETAFPLTELASQGQHTQRSNTSASVEATLARLVTEISSLQWQVNGMKYQQPPPNNRREEKRPTPITAVPSPPPVNSYARVAAKNATVPPPAPTTNNESRSKGPPQKKQKRLPPITTKAKDPTLVITYNPPILANSRLTNYLLTKAAKEAVQALPTATKLRVLVAKWSQRGNTTITFADGHSVNDQIDLQATAITSKLINTASSFDARRVVPRATLQISMVPVRFHNMDEPFTQEEVFAELQANPVFQNVHLAHPPYYTARPERLTEKGERAVITCPINITFNDPRGEVHDRLINKPLVYLFGRRLRVTYRPPRPPFTQCTRCQALGHTAKGCRSPPQCSHCNQQHKTQDHWTKCRMCAAEGIPAGTDCSHPKTCHNCKDNHAAMDPICPKRKKFRQLTPINSSTNTEDKMSDEEL
ncbi:hypothetical protein ACEPAG_7603 [Sanghuangporus baumii]